MAPLWRDLRWQKPGRPLFPRLWFQQPRIGLLSLDFWPFLVHGVTPPLPPRVAFCGRPPAQTMVSGVGGGGRYLLQRNIRPMLNKATAPTSSPTRMTRNLPKSFSGKPDGADKQRVRSDQGVIFVPPPPLSDCGVGEAGLEQKRKELSDTGTQGKWECWHCSRILCPPHPTSSHCPHPLPPPPRERGPTKYISTRAKWIPHNAFLLNT